MSIEPQARLVTAPVLAYSAPVSPLAKLHGELNVSERLYDSADAGRDAWPMFSEAWKASHVVADRASCDLSQAKAAVRTYCRLHGLTAEMLRDLAECV